MCSFLITTTCQLVLKIHYNKTILLKDVAANNMSEKINKSDKVKQFYNK